MEGIDGLNTVVVGLYFYNGIWVTLMLEKKCI